MPTRANRTVHPIQTPRTETQTLFAHFTGGGGGLNCTFDAQSALNGEIETLEHSGATGTYLGTLRYTYPSLVGAPIISSRAEGTAGIFGKVTQIDVTAGTFIAKFYVGNTLTDLATTDTLGMTWSVRMSGKNH